VLLLNTLLLMAVAFPPFATSVLAGALRRGHGERTAVVGVVVIAAFNAYYWLPIPGERPRPQTS
jgi:uncharacterized membrane protein